MDVNVKIVRSHQSRFSLWNNIFFFLLVDCVQPDDNDPDICIPDNQSLCQQSEIFTFSCLHLCGIC